MAYRVSGLGLGGEGTAFHMAKMMERQGGDPRLWAARWLREKGIERDSRTRHELSVLTNALCIKVVFTIS